MKKILYILCFVIFLLPFNTKAASIKSVTIDGASEVNEGEYLPLTFNVNFNGIEKGKDKTLGIWMVGFEISFDKDTFIVGKVSSNGFDTVAYLEDGKYYIVSEVIEDENSSNTCAGGVLYCGNYSVTVNFYVKKTSATNTVIRMDDLGVLTLNMTDPNKEYTGTDATTLENIKSAGKAITINHVETVSKEEPKQNVSTSAPTMKNETIKPTTKPTTNSPTTTTPKDDKKETTKSTNNFLKSLEVDNYDIAFEKEKYSYALTVKEDVNSLKLNIEPEDSKATYRVIGADDLNANGNKILIEVTSESGHTKDYSIIVTKPEKKNANVFKNVFTKKNLKQIGMILGIIILVIIMIAFINHKKNKNIDDMLNKL